MLLGQLLLKSTEISSSIIIFAEETCTDSWSETCLILTHLEMVGQSLPESRSKLSIRPSRFSRPSIYLALEPTS
jgi:hypothetical protein